ncbi:MAG: T9SS type A sorting domain-containing protein, partial [Bacteroidia bacterium]
FSVTVTDANGCTGTSSVTITHLPAPTFSLGADTFICADTFVTLNGPAGMSSYAWSTSATSASITVNTGSNYALTVTDANGCTASDDKLITGLTDCVFPGDANYDGIADNADILSIGAYYGFTGASRPGATLQWYGQSLSNWGGALPGNADPKHSDCDGNGSVAAVDTQAVTLNYGLTHSKGAGVNGGPVQLTVRALADSIHPGDPAWFVVEMGDAQNVADSVYGIALRLTPSGNAMSVPGIFTVDYTNCWFAQALDRLDFTQPLGSNSPVDVAVVRNDQNEQSGFGEVFRFAVATDPNMIPIRDVLQVAVTNVTFVDANLSAMPLTVTNSSIVVSYLVTGVNQLAINPPVVFPNPTNGSVRISQIGTNAMEVTATDILGHSVKTLRNASGNSVLMDTDDLASGIYILRIQTDLGSYLRRLVVE